MTQDVDAGPNSLTHESRFIQTFNGKPGAPSKRLYVKAPKGNPVAPKLALIWKTRHLNSSSPPTIKNLWLQ